MTEDKKPKEMTIEGIRKIIEASGYTLEIGIANILREHGWMVFHQYPYVEKTEKKVKLVDLLAICPHIREPGVSLLIECKKSTKHGWAFHTIKKPNEIQSVVAMMVDFLRKTEGYYLKTELTEKDLSLQLEGFHPAIPETKVGTLCCIPPNHPDDFHEAIYQVLNAMVFLEEKQPQIVFPVIVFDGPMWEFHKNGDLEIRETEYLQFISTTPMVGSALLVDVVNRSYFADFLRLVDGSIAWLRQNLVKEEVTKAG